MDLVESLLENFWGIIFYTNKIYSNQSLKRPYNKKHKILCKNYIIFLVSLDLSFILIYRFTTKLLFYRDIRSDLIGVYFGKES